MAEMRCLPSIQRFFGVLFYTCLVILIVLVFMPDLCGQNENIRFDLYTVKDGLSQNGAMCIAQDEFGFLWVGTKDGLNRFDGDRFEVFNHDPVDSSNISGNYINHLKLCDNGDLIVATSNGLNRFNYLTDKFERVHIVKGEVSFGALDIRSVEEDENSRLWLATENQGLFQIEPYGHVLQHFSSDEFVKDGLANFTFVGKVKNEIWSGTKQHGFLRFSAEDGSFIEQVTDFGLYTLSLLEVSPDNVWLGTDSGLFLLKSADLAVVERHFNENWIPNRLASDSEGNLWVGTISNGLVYLDRELGSVRRFSHIESDPTSLSFSSISSMFIDKAQNLWVGTHGGGLNKLTGLRKFKLYNHIHGDDFSLTSNSIRAIAEDDKGVIFIGSYSGLSAFDNVSKTARHFVVDNKKPTTNLVSVAVYALLFSSTRELWIGTEGTGLQRYFPDQDRFEFFQSLHGSKEFPHDIVLSIFEDSHGVVWVGTANGLHFFEERSNTFKHVQLQEGTETLVVRDIAECDDRHLFVATESGLFWLDRESGTSTRIGELKKDGNCLSSQQILCLYLQNEQTLWLGTQGGGLNRFSFVKKNSGLENRKFGHFTMQQQLPNNVVYGILPDEEAGLWLSTNKGLCRFNTKDQSTTNYTYGHGLQSFEFNNGAYFKASDGNIYFGGIGGLNCFNPGDFETETSVPEVVLTEFKVLNEHFPLDSHIRNCPDVALRYDQNFFGFNFSSLDFTGPEHTTFKYQLHGCDKEVIYAGNRRIAPYTNLPSGDFVFEVWASYDNKTWSENPARVKITITPPFWKAIWFRAILVVAFFRLIYFIIRLRTVRLQEQQNRLKEELRLKAQEIETEKLKAQVGISQAVIDGQNSEQKRMAEDLHDGIGQTLTAALLGTSAIEDKLKSNSADEKLQSQVGMLRKLLDTAIKDIRNITYNLMPSMLQQEGLQSTLEELCFRAGKTLNLKILLKVSLIAGRCTENIEISLYRIVQEVINNTHKHAQASVLKIELEEKDGFLLLTTQDDGKGIGESGSKNHVGNGLKNIQARTELLQGTSLIKSEKGEGTRIEIRVPVKGIAS